MSMGDNAASANAPATTGRAATCATCDGPAPPGKLRCDTCVNAEFDTLRAMSGEEWYNAHKQGRRGEAGHAEP
jgi:hypothetical protein